MNSKYQHRIFIARMYKLTCPQLVSFFLLLLSQILTIYIICKFFSNNIFILFNLDEKASSFKAINNCSNIKKELVIEDTISPDLRTFFR